MPEEAASTAATQFLLIGERTNVTGSPRFAKLILATAITRRPWPGGAPTGRRRGQHPGRQHGRGDARWRKAAMTRFLNLLSAEPDIAKRAHHGGQRPSGASSRPASNASRARASLTRSRSRRARRKFKHSARQLVRRYGAAAVVMAFDEEGQAADQLRAAGRNLHPRLPDPDRGGRISGGGHHLRSEHPDRRHRHRGTQQLRGRFHRGDALDSPANLPGAHVSRRRVEHLIFLPGQHPGARGDALGVSVTTPSAPAWTWASSTPACSPSTRTSRKTCSNASRTCCSTAARRHRTPRRNRRNAQGAEVRRQGKKEDDAWRAGTVEERLSHAMVKGIADFIDADTEEARAKSARPLSRDRRAAHGGHERGGRPVRRGQDVPAAGGQERARDEESRRLPDALHGGGESRAAREANAARRARCSWPRSRATYTTSARTSWASCWRVTTSRSSTWA